MKCVVQGCDQTPQRYRTMCEPHRHRQRKYGSPLGQTPPRASTTAARITAKVDRSAGPEACWPFTGATQHGYGVISDGSAQRKAHRVAYVVFTGEPIPEGLTLDHECHNAAYRQGLCSGGDDCPHRRCCNPSHLVPRSMGDNTARGGGLEPLRAYNRLRANT